MIRFPLVLWHLVLSIVWRVALLLTAVVGAKWAALHCGFYVVYHDEVATQIWDGE